MEEARVEMKCPYCGEGAVYRYGHTAAKKQRYLCLICEKQFTPDSSRAVVNNKPSCPKCGKVMNLYLREGTSLRFRCSNYPTCSTYKKIMPGNKD